MPPLDLSSTPSPIASAPAGAASVVKKPKITDQDLLKPSDISGLRKRIYDHAFEAVQNLEPVSNSRYRLRVENPRWMDPETWSPSHQKKVFYHGGTLARRIQGDWVMEDATTNQPVSRKTATIASVPHLNDRGLFLLNGSHWHLGSQTRLSPGIYPRIQANGDVEAMINPKGGNQHRVALDPASGVFHMEMGASKIPLLPLLKSMGATNEQLQNAWGHDLVVKNAAKDDGVAVGKLLKKLFPDKGPPEGVPHGKAIADKLASMQFDPYVTEKTVKRGHTQHGLEALLDTTRELLALNRGESKPSDRDHQAFQHILGPEHLFAERIKNSRAVTNPLLWKSTFKGSLDNMPAGALNKHILETITATGLGVNAQMTNPAEMLDAAYRVSKMGAGGIRSLDAVPDECYDENTQVFTKSGWVNWAEVTESTELACRIDGALSFYKPLHLYSKEYDGPMYGIKTRTLDQLVTPGHRMWCRKYRSGNGLKRCGIAPWQFELASQSHRKPREFMTASGPYVGTSICDVVHLPVAKTIRNNKRNYLVRMSLNDLAELAGWYAAEGYINRSQVKGHLVAISQSKLANPDKSAAIARLLTKVGVNWQYKGTNFKFCDANIRRWLIDNIGIGSKYKKLPGGFVDWPIAARQKLFNSLVAGDGSTNKNGAITFLSTSKQLRDDFMLLAVSLGHAVRERKTYEHDNPKHNPAYYCGVLISTTQGVTSERQYDSCYYVKNYKGMIYCAEVPGGLLLVRRGRSVGMWSGNSRNVSHSQFHFIDPIVTPESGKAGVDSRFSASSARSKDGTIYTKMYDSTGRPQWVTARELQGKTIAPWESRNSTSPLVEASEDGSMTMVPRDKVHYFSSPTETAFSPVANMVPFKSSSPPHRAAMGTRMMTQALPLVGAEAPLVQSGTPEGGSYEHQYGKHFGAVRADRGGKVLSVGPDAIKVKYNDGETGDIQLHVHELYDHAPGRKTHFTQSAMVKPGDTFDAGHLLARSNYTDQNGRVALGMNARTAWLPARNGGSFEDAFAISESYAKRMKSDHMSLHSVEEPDTKFGKTNFRSLFPAKYPVEHLKSLDENGVVKPGSIVRPGQPLILATKKSQAPRTTLVRSPKPVHQDASEVWDHDYPGEVVDVVKTRGGYRVSVKSAVETQDGDKMCYSEDTEMLTASGWKPVAEVSLNDSVASLNQAGEIEYLLPVATHKFPHTGPMYSLETTQVSLLVTDNHKLYVKKRYASQYTGRPYELAEARDMLGKRFKMKRDGVWKGTTPDYFTFPAIQVDAGQFGRGVRMIPAKKITTKAYLMLLGMFLSEGNTFCEQNGNYGMDIHQTIPANRAKAIRALNEAGIQFTECDAKFRLYGLQLYTHFKQFGKCWEKYIPSEVFNYASEDLKILYDWLMWGDGHVDKQGSSTYSTTSDRLANDFQRLALHIGWSVNIETRPPSRGFIKGKEYDFRACHRLQVYRSKNEPEINSSKSSKREKNKEQMIANPGEFVYCVTLPRNHVLYVRRKGKPVWCGNSGRHGNKGIITIVPDHQMPVGEDGKPFEVLVSPYTLSSRQNASQIAELALGKLAAKHGKPYEIPDFHLPDLVKFAHEELGRHGEKSTETLYDPVTRTKIPNVLTGNQFFMKLHHLVEQKLKQRDVGGYDSFGSPAKGGDTGAKRMSLADTFALLSHGATAFLRGSKLARGQRNEKMWEAILSGYTPPTPGVPTQYKRFIDTLKGGGIHPVVENGKMRLKALTDKDIDHLAGDRELQNTKGIDWSRGGDPIPGGLFDRGLHGEDGCFHASTLVITDQGELPIGQIVKHRLAVKVLSYNFATDEFEWKSIVNWFTNTSAEGLGSAVFRTEARASVLLGRTNKSKLWGTRYHQVYNAAGEKLNLAEATELQAITERLSYTQEQLLYGGLLGDSHVSKNGYLSLTHGSKQSGYLWLKYKVFKPLCDQPPGMYHDESGGSIRDKIHFHTRAHGSMFAAHRLCYVSGRKTLSQEWLDKIEAMGLAIWFFDDGSMKVAKSKKTVTVTLSTECFSAAEIKLLRSWLSCKWGLDTYTCRDSGKYKDRDCGWSVGLSGSFADKLLDLVAPFTPDCLRYKLPLAPATKPCLECGKPIRKLRRFCNQCRVNQAAIGDSTAKRDLARIFGGNTVADANVVLAGPLPVDDLDDSIVLARQAITGTAVSAMLLDTQVKLELTTVPVEYQWKTGENVRYEETQKVYDIEVEGNHNYFAQGMLVSNSRWSKMALHTPMPNPAFEDPVRYTLGITEKQMRNVIAGKGGMSGGKYFEPEEGQQLPHNYETGSSALYNNLKSIDLDKEISRARDDIKGTKKTKRDLAIRKHKFLQGAKDQGIHPSDWMLSKVPVLPPHFRPVSRLQGSNTEMSADSNYLYQDLWNANKNLQELSGRVHDTSEEKLAVYDALKAVVGLGDPINPKSQQKGVKGMLKLMLGDSPKWSTIQHKLLSSPVDLVGRSTVGPDANLDMDEIGMPEDMAYKVYGKFVTKRLVQSGMSPTEAGHALLERKPEANKALLKEMEERPVSYHRAPVLHKYGHIGAWPKLVKGNVIKVSPFVIKGLGMDFDGNCVVHHVKITLEINWKLVYDSLSSQDGLAAWESFKMRLVSTGQVVMEKDKSVVVVEIGSFPKFGTPVKDSKGADVYSVPDGVKVLSYDHSACLAKFEPVTRFTVDHNHACHLVTTARGREVEVSSNESLVAFNHETGEIDKIKPAECVGRMVPTIRKVDVFGDLGNRDLGWWYGVLVADGWVTDRTVGYSKNDEVKREEVIRLAKELFGEFISYEYISEKTEGKYSDSAKIHINNVKIAESVYSLYDPRGNPESRGALRKKIPDALLANGSRECLFGVLSGLLDGDAFVGWTPSKTKPQFVANLYTSSPYLRDDILHLGCRLGIRCSVTITPARNASQESYTICLSIVDLKKVAKEISTIGAEASKALEEFVASDFGLRETRDSVPVTYKQAGVLADACRSVNATLYSTCRAGTKSGRMGRESAQRALEIAGPLPALQGLAAIVANEDVVWDIYESAVATKPQDVFDLEVPTTKVFAIHNGLIIYDTANIHVPVYADEIKDITEKMMPSKNLLSVKDFAPHYKPEREFHVGLWQATEGQNPEGGKRERVFADAAALKRAFQNGEVSVRDKVTVLKH